MNIYDVKINGITNPVGFALDSVKVSWKVDDCISKKQKKARIEISDTDSFDKILYELEGAELKSAGQKLTFDVKPYKRYFLRILVEGDQNESALSDPAWFERGKGKTPWLAEFIGTRPQDTFHPVFQKKFQTEKEISKARLYVTGLGLYEAYLNGKKIGDDYLAPFCNDYNEKIQYQTYDVTDRISQENCIRIYTGNGWYKGRLGYEGAQEVYGNRFAAIAELHLWYTDGTKEVIGTDETWKYQASDIIMSDIYDGEEIDHMKWKDRENTLKKVVLMDISAEKLVERYSLPVVVKESLPVKEIIYTPKGETVLDMGQNFTGYMTFESELPEGTRVTLDFGEVLQQGNFYRDNYRTAKSRFVYVSDGRKEQVRPHFTYFGFRYVRVSGWPGELKPALFKGQVVYSDLETVSQFESSDKNLNRLAANCMWGQKSNFLDMPTDCPQRDERLGWTGDAQVFSPTACYNMDTRAFYRKFLQDLHVEQKKQNGAVPNFIPNLGGLPGGSSVWGDAATFIPMTLYQHYADPCELAEYYEMMKDWVDYIIRLDEENGGRNLWNFGFHFGDWLAQDGISPQSMKGGTDDYLISSVYYYASTKKVAEAAHILGYQKDEEYYANKAELIRQAVLDEFFSPNGRLASDTQTSYFICLKFGIFRDKEKLITGLKERLRKDCYKIRGGFVGATMMCQTLADNGMDDIASYILFQKGFPGWMHCVELGATTIWERWNSILDDGTISGTGMNSLNHYSYGSVMEYVYRYMAGIKENVPGFSSVRFEPQLNNKLKHLKYSYDSVSGRYTCEWTVNKDGSVTVAVEVPFNCTAVLKLPDTAEKEKNLESGRYQFTYKPERDYRKKYTMDSRLEEMRDDTQAMKILQEKLPQAAEMAESDDVENLNTSLRELQYMFFLGFNPEMVQNTAKELLKLNTENFN